MKTSTARGPDSTASRSPDHASPDREAPSAPARGGRIGLVVAASLATGLVAAPLVAATPWVPAETDAVTGAVLCGFALGWAMLAGMSARFTDHPQRWAVAPALFMAVGGLLLVAFGSSARPVLDWVWPPSLLALVVWMTPSMRTQLPSRPARWLLYPVLGVLALSSVGGGFETVSQATDSPDQVMTGQLVDVGDHRLHLSCTGSGGPTVVLEAGGGETAASFDWIAPEVARTTRVCVYDRAGHGWSEPAEHPQDGVQVAADLHTLLDRAEVPGPYVMVGHSFGGLYVLAFADRYPTDVAGMVLVDTTAPKAPADLTAVARDDNTYPVVSRVSALMAVTARLGLSRLIGLSDFGTLPTRSREELRATTAGEAHVRGTIEEYLTASSSMAEAGRVTDLGGTPLMVLTAGRGSPDALVAAHDALAALSTRSEHRTIDGASHSSLVHDEHDAHATAQGILDVVSQLR